MKRETRASSRTKKQQTTKTSKKKSKKGERRQRTELRPGANCQETRKQQQQAHHQCVCEPNMLQMELQAQSSSSGEQLPSSESTGDSVELMKFIRGELEIFFERMHENFQLHDSAQSKLTELQNEFNDNVDRYHRKRKISATFDEVVEELVVDRYLEVNFGGKYVTLDRQIICNPMIKHNFFSTLFDPLWQYVFNRDVTGRIYFEWDYAWVEPILLAFELANASLDNNRLANDPHRHHRHPTCSSIYIRRLCYQF
jgi:hypothetical protein